MTAAPGFDLAAEVADAHAASTLAAADHLDVSFSSGGLAFTTKWQPNALADVQARLTPLSQSVTLSGTAPRPWTVQVANVCELRPRLDGLRSGSRRFRWQPEDLGVFAAAAIWNYLTLPLLIQHAEHVQRLPDAEGARRLRLMLPATLAGHGPVQTLHVGADSLICRHDYTATAFGTWARATQKITRYQSFDGVPVGTTRIVTPRLGRPLPGPTLVWIQIHSVKIAKAEPTTSPGKRGRKHLFDDPWSHLTPMRSGSSRVDVPKDANPPA